MLLRRFIKRPEKKPSPHFYSDSGDALYRVMRNRSISNNAKVALCILLMEGPRNEGSCQRTLVKHMGISSHMLEAALDELEFYGHLLRLPYYKKSNDEIAGYLWLYTDVPCYFIIDDSPIFIDRAGYYLDWEEDVPDAFHIIDHRQSN